MCDGGFGKPPSPASPWGARASCVFASSTNSISPGASCLPEAAANLYSLIASCKLHGLDPERYLAEVIHVMPYWLRDRFLELAPAYWANTRARLDPAEIEAELGFVTVPPLVSTDAA